MNYFDKYSAILLQELNEAAQGGDRDYIVSAASVLSAHYERKDDRAYQLALRITEQAESYDPYAAGALDWYDFVLITYNDLSGDDYGRKLKLYKQVQEWACDYDKNNAFAANNCRELAQAILDYVLEGIEL